MISIRIIVLALHIISAGIWIAQLAAEVAFTGVLRGSQGKPIELPLMMAQVRVVNFLGQVGGIGILLTGFGLLWIEGLAFLNIGGFTPTWLLVKQVVYLAAMLIVFLVLVPTQRRLAPQFIEAARGTPKVTPEIRQLNRRLTWVSRLIDLLVLVNIVLAVWKPT
jgi:hypothetical protein